MSILMNMFIELRYNLKWSKKKISFPFYSKSQKSVCRKKKVLFFIVNDPFE